MFNSYTNEQKYFLRTSIFKAYCQHSNSINDSWLQKQLKEKQRRLVYDDFLKLEEEFQKKRYLPATTTQLVTKVILFIILIFLPIAYLWFYISVNYVKCPWVEKLFTDIGLFEINNFIVKKIENAKYSFNTTVQFTIQLIKIILDIIEKSPPQQQFDLTVILIAILYVIIELFKIIFNFFYNIFFNTHNKHIY